MTDEMTLERAVAQFVVNYKPGDIDEPTKKALKALIKDQFAIQIGASQLPWSKQTRSFRNPRPGKATIVGETTKAAAADAAYLNASYGHGFEYDDFFGNAHPGCAVVPAAFAIAEEVGATLEETMVALVAGHPERRLATTRSFCQFRHRCGRSEALRPHGRADVPCARHCAQSRERSNGVCLDWRID
jgi:2-methylcitrate dehydratase PrpD